MAEYGIGVNLKRAGGFQILDGVIIAKKEKIKMGWFTLRTFEEPRKHYDVCDMNCRKDIHPPVTFLEFRAKGRLFTLHVCQKCADLNAKGKLYLANQIKKAIEKLMQEQQKESKNTMPDKSTGYQCIVDEIYARAKNTNFGCGEPEQSLIISDLRNNDTAEMAALTLVNAFHEKYALVALMQAAIEMIGDAKNIDLIANLTELANAVKTETYGGVYVCDVQEANWFDRREELLKHISTNTKNEA